MKNPSELATPMAFSVYPEEREALKRIMAEHNFRTPFDVVRYLSLESTITKPNDFRPPKVKAK